MLRQFTYFALSGLAATAVHFAVLMALVEFADLSPLLGTCVGALCGAAVGYLCNYYLTFRSRQSHRRVGGRYVLVVINGWVLNALLMGLLLYALTWHYLLLQVIVTGVVMVVNFLLSRYFAFREDDADVH